MSGIKIPGSIPIRQSAENPDAKIRDVAQMYEQHFLNEMTKSMRKTVEHSKLNEPTMAEKIYSEQLDGQYVESWAKTGGVGLADIIYDQLQERFFNRGGSVPRPQGPIPVEKGTTIKIDESRQQGIPVVSPQSTLPTNEVSFLYEWDSNQHCQQNDVKCPYDAKVLQSFRTNEDRQVLKLAHDDGLISTISFLGQTKDLKPGDSVDAGQKLGTLASYANGLTWQVGQVGS